MTSSVEAADRSRGSVGRTSSLISRLRTAALAAGGLLMLAMTGCLDASNFPQTSLDPKSDLAIEIDRLWNLTLVLGVGVSAIVFAILAYILVKYRFREDAPQP